MKVGTPPPSPTRITKKQQKENMTKAIDHSDHETACTNTYDVATFDTIESCLLREAINSIVALSGELANAADSAMEGIARAAYEVMTDTVPDPDSSEGKARATALKESATYGSDWSALLSGARQYGIIMDVDSVEIELNADSEETELVIKAEGLQLMLGLTVRTNERREVLLTETLDDLYESPSFDSGK